MSPINQLNQIQHTLEEGMTGIRRTIPVPRPVSEFSQEKAQAACPEQPGGIRDPLAERPAQRRAANSDEPPPVSEPVSGLSDLIIQRSGEGPGALKVGGHQGFSAFRDSAAAGSRLSVLAGNRR